MKGENEQYHPARWRHYRDVVIWSLLDVRPLIYVPFPLHFERVSRRAGDAFLGEACQK
jgi:hypothetical protein